MKTGDLVAMGWNYSLWKIVGFQERWGFKPDGKSTVGTYGKYQEAICEKVGAPHIRGTEWEWNLKQVEKRMFEPNTCANPRSDSFLGEVRIGGWIAKYNRGSQQEVENWLNSIEDTEISEGASNEMLAMVKRWANK